ncbi:hypothetical protein PENSPDRAFT_755278 [Peniophora sp. CONT]|nr:hypothetical protein PENSPDRAFT_755278 [Peniophora sp. CONT]
MRFGFSIVAVVAASCITVANAAVLSPSTLQLNFWTSGLPDFTSSAVVCGGPQTASNFWECARRLGDRVKYGAEDVLDDARRKYRDASDKIILFEQQARKVAESSLRLTQSIISDPQVVQELVDNAVEDGMLMLKEEFPPPDTADGHAARQEHMARTLDVVFGRVAGVLSEHTSLSEEDLQNELAGVRSASEAFLITAGDLIEQHPELVRNLLITGAVLVWVALPEGFFLRPILRIVGFGPEGVVKGSIAAWYQRFFWGSAVESGSLFALLQRAGAVIVSMRFRLAGIFITTVLSTCVANAAVPRTFSSQVGNLWSSSISAFTDDPCEDPRTPAQFWQCARRLGNKLRADIDVQLSDARQNFQDVADKISDFEAQAQKIGEAAQVLGQRLIIDPSYTEVLLEEAVEGGLHKLKEEFPPPETVDGHVARREHVSRTLDVVIDHICEALPSQVNLSEEELRKELAGVRDALESFIVITGDLVEQHPVLVDVLLMSGSVLAGLFVPEWWIIRPLLRAVGFGPLGPVKGSAAAWAQRFFWGGAVKKDSWFAALQRAGMIGVPWFKRAFCAVCGWLGWLRYCKA